MPRAVGSCKLQCVNCKCVHLFPSWRPKPLCPFCIGEATLVRRVKPRNKARTNRMRVAHLFADPVRLSRNGRDMVPNKATTFAM